MELIIFTGIQGSGKSTFYRRRFAMTHLLISKDLMPNVRKKNDRQRELIEEYLGRGESVVLDNTSPRPEDRAEIIAAGKRAGAKIIGYLFETKVNEAIARNEKREGRAVVPKVAIFVTAKKLRPQTFEEGFDELYRVRIEGDDFVVTKIERAE